MIWQKHFTSKEIKPRELEQEEGDEQGSRKLGLTFSNLDLMKFFDLLNAKMREIKRRELCCKREGK